MNMGGWESAGSTGDVRVVVGKSDWQLGGVGVAWQCTGFVSSHNEISSQQHYNTISHSVTGSMPITHCIIYQQTHNARQGNDNNYSIERKFTFNTV